MGLISSTYKLYFGCINPLTEKLELKNVSASTASIISDQMVSALILKSHTTIYAFDLFELCLFSIPEIAYPLNILKNFI